MKSRYFQNQLAEEFILKLINTKTLPIAGITVIGSSAVGKTNQFRPEVDLIIFLDHFRSDYFLQIGKTIESLSEDHDGINIILGTLELVWRYKQGENSKSLHLMLIDTSELGSSESYGLHPITLRNMVDNRVVLYGRDILAQFEHLVINRDEMVDLYLRYLNINRARLIDIGVMYGASSDPNFLIDNCIEFGKKVFYKAVGPLLNVPGQAGSICANKVELHRFLLYNYPSLKNEIELFFKALTIDYESDVTNSFCEELYGAVFKALIVIEERLRDIKKQN
jgi:hypothetical protein